MALPLRRNEVVCAFLDPQPLPAELPRATTIPFLGRQGRFLIGSVAVAQRLGTPILPMIAYRAPDWVHQTLEILPPVTPGADATETFQRCMAVFEQAIRQRPGAWHYWWLVDDLRAMGLLPSLDAPAAEVPDALATPSEAPAKEMAEKVPVAVGPGEHRPSSRMR
jgi:hypothetical protein